MDVAGKEGCSVGKNWGNESKECNAQHKGLSVCTCKRDNDKDMYPGVAGNTSGWGLLI